jgi:hypothetical protein
MTLPPSDSISFWIRLSLFSLRAANTTLAPREDKPFASPSPMPDDAPVMIKMDPEIFMITL